MVVQGSGHAGARRPVPARWRRRRPSRVALIERFDRDMARRIYAGADLFLMPSRFEPCGQGQMISLRYGTPPVVRRTGGLADTVIDQTAHPKTGTGFVFDEATPTACWTHANARWRCGRPAASRWAALLDRGMAVDFDWVTGAAPQYVAAYERAAAIRAASTS